MPTTPTSRRPLLRSRLRLPHVEPTLAKVPEVGVLFWVIKLITTGVGEAFSDFMGQTFIPAAAVIGVGGTFLAFRWQLRARAYHAPTYWFAVLMVAVFGTMVADGLTMTGLSYAVTTPVFAAALAAVFWRWHRSEGTLSIHSIVTARREGLYWSAVLTSFALGTAAGDLTAIQLHLGYWDSAILFGLAMAIPAVAWQLGLLSPIVAFWSCYVLTRPLGASFADGFSKPISETGLGLGDGPVALVGLLAFAALVTYLARTRGDLQQPGPERSHDRHVHLAGPEHPEVPAPRQA
ncbi:MAG: hypothetical protein PGN13_01470 [Patulibacter minatonensis]